MTGQDTTSRRYFTIEYKYFGLVRIFGLRRSFYLFNMAQTTIELDINSLREILKEKGEIFEKLEEINYNYLPLNIDVLAIVENVQAGKNICASYNDCYPTVTKTIIDLWEKTGIPIVQYKCVRKKIIQLVDKYKKTKLKIHRENCRSKDLVFQLFIISSCKCSIFDTPKECKCPIQNKISDSGLAFLIDQKAERNFTLTNYKFSINSENSVFDCNGNDSNASGQHSQNESHNNHWPIALTSSASEPDPLSESDGEKENDDPDYLPEKVSSVPSKITLPNSLAELKFESVFAEAVRFNTSYQQVASIINRTLEVVGAITNNDKGLVVTPSFVQRGVKRIGKKITKMWNEDNIKNKLQCFFFDGVKAKNCMIVNKNGALMRDNSVNYENIVMVAQPRDRYLGFIAIKECNANAIFNGMRNFYNENNIGLCDLIAIGSDGASTNTGADNGIISKFETYLNRSLHWIICMLHLMDLILKAVVSLYYGDTIGPGVYFGKINEELHGCHTLPIVEFATVSLKNMPACCTQSFDQSRLNYDQKYLYELSQAVDTGNVTGHLADRKPGELSEPRWTTLASRMLRLYISSENPSLKLISLVHFIQNVYVPSLFWIKCFPDWTDGARHLFRILSFARSLPKEVFNVVNARVLYNSYFAHSENLLLSMISDPDIEIRRYGYKQILQARSTNMTRDLVSDVRVFKKPVRLEVKHPTDIKKGEKYRVDHYSKMINWEEAEILEPPFTFKLTDNQLTYYMNNDNEIIDIPPIPLHSQATELCVQLVKNIVVKYPGIEVQEGRIKTKIFARSLNQQFNSRSQRKADYECFDENI